jgi:hypothetical protein
MKTDDLIRLLATSAGPAPDGVVRQRVSAALLAGVVASAIACLATLGLNPALAAMGLPLAVKLMYVLGVLGAAGWWLSRVARPAATARRATVALAGVVAAMTVWTALVLIDAPAGGRAAMLYGQSWVSCPWRVAVLSLPALALALWALRGLAPTHARLAGFVAGLLGGAAGALAYALFCSEVSPAFVLIWYSLGMLVPAGVGAWLGPRLLSW